MANKKFIEAFKNAQRNSNKMFGWELIMLQ